MAEKRKIGKELTVTPVGLGCMGFSHAYGAPTERKEAVSMIRKAYDMGYDFFDTAECYTGVNARGVESVGRRKEGRQDPVYRCFQYDAEDLERMDSAI